MTQDEQIRAVVADDDQDILYLASYALEKLGWKTYKAENGKIALQMIRQHRPHCIILDIHMPVLDGYGVLQEMHDDPSISDIPVIVVTASVEENHLKEASRMGASAFIRKPFSPIEFRAKALEIVSHSL